MKSIVTASCIVSEMQGLLESVVPFIVVQCPRLCWCCRIDISIEHSRGLCFHGLHARRKQILL